MWIIDFFKSNCKNCYACVRACPVNAIQVQAEQAKIVKERCIGCGKCLKVCPKNAKHVQSELEKVKTYLKQEGKVVASVAPSFAALFDKGSEKLPAALKKLGFDVVEETVVGAELVTEVYEAYSKMPGDQCYMTSCCPTVNALIQKHYPEVIPFLIPVVSPAACHGKMIKRHYGKETKVVFIGPCLSKKIEGIEEESIDAVLTFEELLEWIKEEKIDWENLQTMPFDATEERQRRYPIVGGMTHTIKDQSLPRKIIQIDGVDECIDMMPHIMKGAFKNTLIEIHGCRQSCISGAGMPQDGVNIYERRERIKKYAEGQSIEVPPEEEKTITDSINLHKEFHNLKHQLKIPSEEEIESILNSIGKETKLDELNCGSCGYKTCRDKAIAVFNDMAEPNMCLPFMRQKAETLTNIIFEATPNLIIMVNEALEVIEINPAARKFFDLSKDISNRLPVSALMDEESFKEVRRMKKSILNQKIFLHGIDATVVQSIIWSDYHAIMVWIANDVTYDEKKNKQLQNMKIEAIDMAQQVINKQMTVAQEIASLLGETTAETKVTLTKLKQLIQEEEAMKR
ncbi:[Fe-Fe] hydrogenase large subunit C-terminal domain-containing protein [Cellulosilyticum sp. ST5]|uniref:[Fe-Fe] hydrogenase large subunit C-terminal domain-containing protein n=1 Tax=Cellulosilyticum sp. ST5 TaxID=3055805 RepID=UPI003977570B